MKTKKTTQLSEAFSGVAEDDATTREEESSSAPRNVDFCIVGGGLAGVMFALKARARGFQCVVIDKPELSAASRVSAGLINPIAGKRFAPFWEADAVLPSALAMYETLERRFGQTLARPMRAARFFTSESEREYWFLKRAGALTFAAYKPPEAWDAAYNQRYGGLEYDAWIVDVEATVRLARAHLKEEGALIEEEFDAAALSFHGEGVRYKGLRAARLAMCNGWKILRSPLWERLPLLPAKGELLTVKPKPEADARAVEILTSALHIKEAFIAPLSRKSSLENTEFAGLGELDAPQFRIGATYSWDELNETPTEENARRLLEAAFDLVPAPMTILRHDAGVRPAAQDSKPIVGAHPAEPRCVLLNGFGSKGAAYAPYCAEVLLNFLTESSPLPEWCALARWKAWR